MNPETTATPNSTWPGAFGVFKLSKRAILLNLGPILVIGIISLILSAIMPTDADTAAGAILFFQLFSLVVSSVSSIALTDLELAGANEEKLTTKEAFRKVPELWLKMIGLVILTGAIVIGSLLLFIIPFFFVFPRVALATYFMVDKKLGPIDSIKASWNQTKGHSAKVWGIFGVCFLMIIPAFTLILIPLTIYLLVMYAAAMAILYRHITGNTLEVQQTNDFQGTHNTQQSQPFAELNEIAPPVIPESSNTPDQEGSEPKDETV